MENKSRFGIPQDLVCLYEKHLSDLDKIINEATLGRICLFFTNEQTNQIQKLEIGEIQKIKSRHPRKAEIYFGEPGMFRPRVSLDFKDLFVSSATICELLKLSGMASPAISVDDEEFSDAEIQDAYNKNPADRKVRLFRRALDIADALLKEKKRLALKEIHKQIIKEEKGKSDVNIGTLKHEIKLCKIKAELKKRKSEGVN